MNNDYTQNQRPFREGIHGAEDSTEAAVQALRDAALRADERVRTIVREHPFVALAGAIAVGYVVGRILSSGR
jgi:ElaB/YqjD/DUF883 family membrane-anchored ribosome-binding protein